MHTQSTITVVGLGSGHIDQLTLGVWKTLKNATHLYVRTEDHPMLQLLKQEAISFTSFDDLYVSHEQFADVYEKIATTLVTLAQSQGHIVYAVPGHPMVAEKTVQLLKQACPDYGILLEIRGGESFLDQAFTRLGFDPIEGFQLLDATELSSSLLRPQMHTLIGQVYDQFTASDVKLALMDVYPDEFPVVIAHALGVPEQEQMITVPLYELDRHANYGNLSIIWIPRSDDDSLRNRTFERLHEIVRTLRSPGGCPWDMEQTHQSIRKNFIEETYEAIEAIDEDDPDKMQEEFGDVLLQIMLHSQMEEEQGMFTVFDVLQTLNEKLLFRHPHVFGDSKAGTSTEALQSWERMKAEEKKRKGLAANASLLDGIPASLPEAMKAYQLQKKASKVGFDWTEIEPVLNKVREEIDELQEVIASGEKQKQIDELGDLLFALINVTRFIHTDPEEVVARANRKFIRRFSYIEQQLKLQGRTPAQSTLEEMDRYWDEAKRLE